MADEKDDEGTVPAVFPEPLEVGSGPYDPPEGASTENLGEPAVFPDPLPVGSGPYEPPPGAAEISQGKVPEEVGGAPTTEAEVDAEATATAYDDYTKDELQAELDARSLPTTGNKPELIDRLVADD